MATVELLRLSNELESTGYSEITTELLIKLTKSIVETLNSKGKQSTGNESLLKCGVSCSQLEKINVQDINTGFKEWIKIYTQAVLDLTFYDENKLVDEDFPESKSAQEVRCLIEQLSQPEQILQISNLSQKEIKDILGDEVLECLYWRRGALLYMYCSTIQEDQTRQGREKPLFCCCAQEGVDYLESMFNVRSPLQESRSEVTTNDESIFSLLKKGLYSDTHVLALMYGGELCYWCIHLRSSENTKDKSTPVEEKLWTIEKLKNKGKTFLQTFADAVNGPLKNKGWSCDRAVELLKELEDTQT